MENFDSTAYGESDAAACSSSRERHEYICDTPKCRWGGDSDDLTFSTYHGTEDGDGPLECSGDETDARWCCPKCLLANLIETEGWDDDQLPVEAFRKTRPYGCDRFQPGTFRPN